MIIKNGPRQYEYWPCGECGVNRQHHDSARLKVPHEYREATDEEAGKWKRLMPVMD